MNKILSLLTIARKAGKIVFGMDPCKDACRSGKATLILLSSNLSEKSKKEMYFFCGKENMQVKEVDITIEEVWQNLGKKAGVVALLDQGFSDKILSYIN